MLEHPVGGAVEKTMAQWKDGEEQVQRTGQRHGGRRAADGDRFGHQLAEDHVQEGERREASVSEMNLPITDAGTLM
jgi:hypothetical protein